MPAHINAYYEELEMAKQEARAAAAKVQAAEAALKAHPDYVAPAAPKEEKPAEPKVTKTKPK